MYIILNETICGSEDYGSTDNLMLFFGQIIGIYLKKLRGWFWPKATLNGRRNSAKFIFNRVNAIVGQVYEIR